MFEISKKFEWSSSHILDALPEGHKCARLHGHNYICEVVLRSTTVDERGFVEDYGDLAPIKRFIDDHLDHKHLASSERDLERFNLGAHEVFILGCQTSAENIAQFLYQQFKPMFPALYEVRISETPKTWAVYREGKAE